MNQVSTEQGSILKTRHTINFRNTDGSSNALPAGTRAMITKGGPNCHIAYDFFLPNGDQMIFAVDAKHIVKDHVNAELHLDPLLEGFSVKDSSISQDGFRYTLCLNDKPVGEAERIRIGQANRFELQDEQAREKIAQAVSATQQVLKSQGREVEDFEIREMLADYFAEGYHRGFMTLAEFIQHLYRLWLL